MNNNSRYEILVCNGANGATEQVFANSLYAFGGYFSSHDSAMLHFNNGECVARIYDKQNPNKITWLVNIEW